MPKIQLKHADFTPIPEDVYPARLQSWEIKDDKGGSAKDKSQHVELKFSITEGEYNGRNVWRNYSLKENALPFLKQALLRLGADPEVLNDDDGVDLEDVLPDLVGAECRLDIGIREYPDGSGEMKNDVKSIMGDISFV